ncbi:glycosyltransferase family 9 protein [Arthrobacter sp. B10-11]|uniref:glycosyltransferase family 9 protein n=1 Tax=Arthrobacter sp. B10-11 TaxID=3081160 RepID=UPI002955143B|nr:glycosyltransferase family 9 protein [Arthrobacter sp. B10-11]MDV8147528.1 glycosyltransferase family 9 protein [Arthrobacter sp. B10-11]
MEGTSTDQAAGRGVGPVLGKFDGVSRIAVLRGGGLGDLMFALPAVSALKAAYPGSTVTVLGTPLHAALVQGTAGPVDDVRILPYAEGVRPGQEDPAAVDSFFADMRREAFDLALQLHGGGRYSNPFLLRLGARHTVGTQTPDAAPLERNLPYAYYQHEPLRALEVAGLAGAPPVGLEASLQPLARFAAGADRLLGQAATAPAGTARRKAGPVVVIHPGATDPRRRWPARHFAELAAACAADGCQVLVTGDHSERQLAADIVARAGAGLVRSIAGEADLGTLAALLVRADVMVANDSGPRHLAQALGTPTVGVYWAGNLINAGPLGRSLHRVHLSWLTYCPECGADVTQVGWTAPRCSHDSSLVAGVRPENVCSDVRLLMATSPHLRGRPAFP